MTSFVQRNADVIIIGGGLGGLAGALSASALGLNSIILEKSAWIGGGASYSGGLCWVPGLGSDSIPDAYRYIEYAQGERYFDEALLLTVLQAMADAIDFYRTSGVRLEIVKGNPDVYYPNAPGSVASGRMWECVEDGRSLGSWRDRILPTPHYRIGLRHSELFKEGLSDTMRESWFASRQAEDLLTMGPGLVASFARVTLVEHNVPCYTREPVTSLIVEGNRVVGVNTSGSNGLHEWRASRGVLLAAGGYGWSSEARDLEGLPDHVEAGPPSIEGDHLRIAGGVGAFIARAGEPQFSMGAQILDTDRHPGTDVPLYSQLFDVMGKPHSLVVNRHGMRFADESYYVGMNEAVREWNATTKKWANFPCYLIVDEQFRRQYPLGSIRAGDEYPASIVRTDNLDDLASLVGLPQDVFRQTIERFNEDARAGNDPDFGRGASPFIRRRYGDLDHLPNANLGDVSEPPFYLIPLRPLGFGICSMGLVTDSQGRVLRKDGTAIAGLFSTGNSVATTEFRGYVTGYANSRNMAMAHASVQSMLDEVGEKMQGSSL